MADPATTYTAAFVRAALPPGARRVLEVGCGEGALAAELQSQGLCVVALDSEGQAVDRARERGVDARRATWPDFAGGRFDAVLFTRSLHHVEDLDAGVAAAFDCLAEGGRVIVEDFDFDYADEPTLAWFASQARLLAACQPVEASSLLASLVELDGRPLEAWRRDHHHPLHGARAIEAALRRTARNVTGSGAAYFFRYVASAIPGNPALAEKLLRSELDLIAEGRIEPLGRRYVAQPSPAPFSEAR